LVCPNKGVRLVMQLVIYPDPSFLLLPPSSLLKSWLISPILYITFYEGHSKDMKKVNNHVN